MSDALEQKIIKRSFGKYIAIVFAIILAIFVVAFIALRLFLMSDAGAKFVETQVNKRQFGPIKKLVISDIDGDLLKHFTVGDVKLYDKSGLFLDAKALEISWSPWALKNKRLQFNTVDIQNASLLRRPEFEERKTKPAPNQWSVNIDDGQINNVLVEEPVWGQRSVLNIQTRFQQSSKNEITAKLNAVRTDGVENSLGDSLSLDFKRRPNGDMSGSFNIKGEKGGSFATALKTPENTDLIGNGTIKGTVQSGGSDFTLTFSNAEKLSLSTQWDKNTLNVDGQLNTMNWPLLASYQKSLGQTLKFNGMFERKEDTPQFGISAQSSTLKAEIAGALNSKGGLPKSANITLESESIESFLDLPDAYTLGRVALTGRLDTTTDLSFVGTVSGNKATTPYGVAQSIQGPLSIKQQSDDTYTVHYNPIIKGLKSAQALPIQISPETRVKFAGLFSRNKNTLSNIIAEIISGKNKVSSKGQLNLDTKTFVLKGQLQAALSELGTIPTGDLQTLYDVKMGANGQLKLKAEGAFRPTTDAATQFSKLLAGGVNFDVNVEQKDKNIALNQVFINAENLNIALNGLVGDALNIKGEALLNAAFETNGIMLQDKTNASFTLTGTRENPSLKLDARSESMSVNSIDLNEVRLKADVSQLLKAPKGPVQLIADTQYGALDASLNFASEAEFYKAEDISITLDKITTTGQLSLNKAGGVIGRMELSAPENSGSQKKEQFAKAVLDLNVENKIQVIAFNADAKNITFSDYNVNNFKVEARGNLSNLNGTLKTEGFQNVGFIERAFSIDSPLSLARDTDGIFKFGASPAIDYGTLSVTTTNPVELSFNTGDILLDAGFAIEGSPAIVKYEKTATGEILTATLSDLPIRSLPLPSALSDTNGKVGFDINLRAINNGSVAGEIKTTLADWRGFDVKSGKGVSGTLDLSVNASELDWQISANSADDFNTRGQGKATLQTASTLKDMRLNMSAPISGNITSSGSIASLLTLISSPDANPKGMLSANLNIAGTPAAPLISGQANGQKISAEMPTLGTQVEKGRFKAKFSNDTLVLQDVFISDGKDGTLAGEGDFKLGELGRPLGKLSLKAENFRALDRRDYEGKVKGTLAYESLPKRGKISGNVTLLRTEVKEFVRGKAAVIEINVKELNKPDNDDEDIIIVPQFPIELDVKIKAPRRVFVRSRGLDVELSLDAAIKGTLENPEIFGEANVVRGGYRLAGKELQFETGSIFFNGPIGTARVNLVARTDTQNLNAAVKITGTVEKPEINLSSEPERPNDEILSALLFGRSVTELSTIEAAQLAGALAQFSGAGGGFNLLGGLRDALGVGQLSIGVGENGAAQITGGRYLAKNVYLQVFSGADESQTGAVIDWEIRKNLSLRSKVQADSEQSFSLKWQKNF